MNGMVPCPVCMTPAFSDTMGKSGPPIAVSPSYHRQGKQVGCPLCLGTRRVSAESAAAWRLGGLLGASAISTKANRAIIKEIACVYKTSNWCATCGKHLNARTPSALGEHCNGTTCAAPPDMMDTPVAADVAKKLDSIWKEARDKGGWKSGTYVGTTHPRQSAYAGAPPQKPRIPISELRLPNSQRSPRHRR